MSTGCWGDSSKGPWCGQRSRPTCETRTSETSPPAQTKATCPPTAPNMPKKPHLPQAHPQAHDQRLSRKLVERSQSILKQRELTNCLPCDKPPASNPPLSVPILPGRVHDQPDHPVHVPPFLSPAPVLQRPKALNEVDAEYDPLMDTDSPNDDALVEIEYR